MASDLKLTREPVTVFISRRVKTGAIKEIKAWTQEIRVACAKYPGFLGAVTLDSHHDSGDGFHVAFRFASFEELRAWEESPERQALYEKLQPWLEEEHSAKLSGLEPWFPSNGLNQPTSPPKWKIWVMALLAVYPTAFAANFFLDSLLRGLPLLLSVFIICIPISFLMSFFAMPWLTRVFRGWLYPGSSGQG